MIGVVIAGIGGASLGTEIAKSLRLVGRYRIVGLDVSSLAFGHYGRLCDMTYVVSRDRYIDDVLEIATREDASVVVPGAEEPMILIAEAGARFAQAGISLAMNSAEIVRRLSDKAECFRMLQVLGIRIPRTAAITCAEEIEQAPLPCVIKPSIDSGGSSFVFFARDRKEASLYAAYLLHNGKRPIAQEYISHEGGEFTVGVLSDQTGSVLGTIALKRAFPNKLSIAAKGRDFLISSGYSQGHIGTYEGVCETAHRIALAVGSLGPINVQGRVDRKGDFLPFEINPRFSASTHLRALAGFNEIDCFIRHLLGEREIGGLTVRAGWYLRSLTEAVVPEGGLVS